MEVQVGYIAVLLAALSSMAVGALWYSPALVYNQWKALAKLKHNHDAMTNAMMAILYGRVFLASGITAYVLAHLKKSKPLSRAAKLQHRSKKSKLNLQVIERVGS